MKWVTREHPKTDRVACPWLIRKLTPVILGTGQATLSTPPAGTDANCYLAENDLVVRRHSMW